MSVKSIKMAGREVAETDIRDFIFEYLSRRGYFVWRDRQSNSRNFRGVNFPESKGRPDIIGMTKDGRFLGIEVKRPKKGVVSDEQVAFHEKIKLNGGIIIIATELSDVVVGLKNAGVR